MFAAFIKKLQDTLSLVSSKSRLGFAVMTPLLLFFLVSIASYAVAQDATPTPTKPIYSCQVSFLFWSHPPQVSDDEGRIFVVDINGKNFHKLSDKRADTFSWSPDGNYVAFIGDSPSQESLYDLYVIDKDGNNLQDVAQNVVAVVPAWSPDSQLIAFVSVQAKNTALYSIHRDGTNLSLILDHTGDFFLPSWSPDGSHIAIVIGFYDLYILDVNGNNLHLLASNTSEPKWSPDGIHIIFTSRAPDNRFRVYIGDIYGNIRPLTDLAGQNFNPEWSPDGSQIVFVSDRDGNEEIYVTNSDGSSPRRLTNRDAADYFPIWASDGQYIGFESNAEDHNDIWLISPDGSDLHSLKLPIEIPAAAQWSLTCSHN